MTRFVSKEVCHKSSSNSARGVYSIPYVLVDMVYVSAIREVRATAKDTLWREGWIATGQSISALAEALALELR